MSAYYASFPKAVIAYPTTNLSYMIVSYYGNTAATSGTITSTNQTSGTYTSPDLSFNTLYYFTLTPYNASGAGVAKTLNVDTTPKVSGVKATYSTTANAVLQWSGTYKYVKLSRADGVGSGRTVGAYTDISSVVLSQPYIDKDLSGNRTYKYYIPPYDSGGNAAAPSNC
jgi:hypothetical protein